MQLNGTRVPQPRAQSHSTRSSCRNPCASAALQDCPSGVDLMGKSPASCMRCVHRPSQGHPHWWSHAPREFKVQRSLLFFPDLTRACHKGPYGPKGAWSYILSTFCGCLRYGGGCANRIVPRRLEILAPKNPCIVTATLCFAFPYHQRAPFATPQAAGASFHLLIRISVHPSSAENPPLCPVAVTGVPFCFYCPSVVCKPTVYMGP